MSKSGDGLVGKLVSDDFWPRCSNCALYQGCRDGAPRHEAFPHTWHWGRRAAHFGDDVLILKSWVGTIVIGEPHTGCYSYAVDPNLVHEPGEIHRRYMELETELQQIDVAIERHEQKGDFEGAIDLYARWEKIFGEQQRLAKET